MSNSEHLQKNRNQHGKKNQESRKQDNLIVRTMEKTKQNLQLEYPGLDFGIEKTFKVKNLNFTEKVTISEDSRFQPDGGFLYVMLNEKKLYLLVSEQKKQGTADVRFQKGLIKEGQAPGARGNAVERLGKNYIAVEQIFADEDIFPFVVFLQGCDFYEEESTIADRVKVIFRLLPQNTINLFKKQIGKTLWVGGSYFMRGHSYKEKPGTSDWTFDEIYNINNTIAFESLKYYISNYGE